MDGLSLYAIGEEEVPCLEGEAVRQWIVKFETFFASRRRRLSTVKRRPAILFDETGIKWEWEDRILLDLPRPPAKRGVVSAKSYPSVSVLSTIDTVKQALTKGVQQEEEKADLHRRWTMHWCIHPAGETILCRFDIRPDDGHNTIRPTSNLRSDNSRPVR